MEIQITGVRLDVGESLRDYARVSIEKHISKYFTEGVEVNITFSKQGDTFKSDCGVHLSTGQHLQAHAENSDVYICFDQSVEKIDKQLRRTHRRLKEH